MFLVKISFVTPVNRDYLPQIYNRKIELNDLKINKKIAFITKNVQK